MKMSNKVYDQVRFCALVLFPALAVFYAVTGALWNFPLVDQVSGTLVAIDTFLGAVVLRSSKQYADDPDTHDGTVQQVGVDPDTGMPHLAMTINKTPGELLENKTVRLKVTADNVTPPPAPGSEDHGK